MTSFAYYYNNNKLPLLKNIGVQKSETAGENIFTYNLPKIEYFACVLNPEISYYLLS